MKRLLLVSPHFPPDASAGAHRARVIAPYLAAVGWRPTILTVAPEGYAGTLDAELVAMLPADLDVVRVPAWRVGAARRLGFGDLGLRSLPGLWRTARALTSTTRFDAVFLTTYPVYPAILAERLRARSGAPVVIDLQDPWTGAWGLTVGGGPDGRPDLRSRLSRHVMAMIEERAIPACDAITGVSAALLEELRDRYPALRHRPSLALPIGIDPHDVEWARTHPKPVVGFDPDDGNFHLSAVGTLLPLAIEPLRAVLSAVAALREQDPARAGRLRLHFVGTSNQADDAAPLRVAPIAQALGVSDLVHEHPARIPFADALRLQLASSALLVVGSTEARYTASKVAPVLATGRPVLAVAHEDSDMVEALGRAAAGEPSIRLAAFGDDPRSASDCVARVLGDWLRAAPAAHGASGVVRDLTGPLLAARLAGLLDSLGAKPRD